MLGKATQKQKAKRGYLKNKDLNRKGAEKEGTDMDAFVNTAPPPAKPEVKQTEPAKQQENKETSPHLKESEKESAKDVKDEENAKESKKEAESKLALKIEQAAPEASKDNTPVHTPTTEKLPLSVVQNNKESSKESTPTIEETCTIEEPSRMPVKTIANDVVDFINAEPSWPTPESAIVAQKNEENVKVSALRASSETPEETAPEVQKESENQEPEQNDSTAKDPPPLKYTYRDDQWSPLNKSGKKVYDREFLYKLQNDPNSKIKPLNLPDLEVVLKDNSRVSSCILILFSSEYHFDSIEKLS